MNKFKTILAVLAIASLEFVKGKTLLSKEQVEKLQAEHKRKFGSDMTLEGLAYDNDGYMSFFEAELESIEAALNMQATSQKPEAEKPEGISAEEFAKLQKQVQELSQKNTQLESQISKLSDNKEEVVDAVVIKLGTNNQTKKSQMQTWDNPKRPWNMRANAMVNGADLDEIEVFIGATSTTDYSAIIEDLGDYYKVRFKDDLNSFIKEYADLRKIFPVRSNIQDEAIIGNVFLEEFSQAYQSDFTSKGGFVFQPEKVKMYDVKFDHKFTKMKELEKNWLGYLNTSGSDALKMPFVKYLMQETLKKLFNEQQVRLINGVYVAPTSGVAGPAINAANGLRKLIRVKIAENKIKTFAIGEMNITNIVDNLNTMATMIPEQLRNSGALKCYISEDLKYMYFKNLENTTATHQDYVPGNTKLKFHENISLVVIPGMGLSQRVIFTFENNIMLCEDKPNEMSMIKYEQEDRSLKAWSDWRESVHIDMIGKQWDDIADADYEHQMIWVNDVDLPSSVFEKMLADDTTPSVANHTSLESVANTAATAITNIDDMAIGQTVILKCGSDTNAITIAKSGNFANLKSAWSPSKGDTITLYKRGATDIIDLGRTSVTTDAIVIAADDATPTVAAGTVFITSANTTATAITDLDNPTPGLTYTIHGGSSTNASTIANSGNFSLSAAMTLSAGTYIKLYCRADNDYVELERG